MQAKVVEDKENPNRVGIHLDNTSNVTGNLFFRYTPTENLYGEIGVTGTGKRYGYDSRNKEVTTLPALPELMPCSAGTIKMLTLPLPRPICSIKNIGVRTLCRVIRAAILLG